jgi:putative transposase
MQDDAHFLTVCRYVERNAVRGELVERAEEWRWGSLWRWRQSAEPAPKLLSPWPISRPPRWVQRVNEPMTDGELSAIRKAAQKGCPLGDANWVESAVKRLGLESTLRPRGRPQVRFPNKES